MLKGTLLAATTALALAATPALAQQHQHGQGGMTDQGSMMQGMHGCMMQGDTMGMMGSMGMMGAMGAAMHAQPAMLLGAADELELTTEQTEALTTLRDQTQSEHQEHMQGAMAGRRAAVEALEGDAPDLDAYAEALEEAADHTVLAHVAMTRTALEARELLTDEQLERLDDVMRAKHGMQGGMMGGGMMGGGGGQAAPSPDHLSHH